MKANTFQIISQPINKPRKAPNNTPNKLPNIRNIPMMSSLPFFLIDVSGASVTTLSGEAPDHQDIRY
jgi:hypothetical protein